LVLLIFHYILFQSSPTIEFIGVFFVTRSERTLNFIMMDNKNFRQDLIQKLTERIFHNPYAFVKMRSFYDKSFGQLIPEVTKCHVIRLK
jgi:hypothetical protein